jgi:hypothetical protein
VGSFLLGLRRRPTPLADGADNGLAALVDVYVLDCHALMALASIPI